MVTDGTSTSLTMSSLQVTRIDGTVDSPPCLKVTHKTFGTQNSNGDTVFCRLSMPVEFHSVFKSTPAVDMNGVHDEDTLKVKHRCPAARHRQGFRNWLPGCRRFLTCARHEPLQPPSITPVN